MTRSAAISPVRSTVLLMVVSAILPSVGCRLCCETDDHNYAAYGGAWERTRRDSGRVGSTFDPAGAKSSTLVQRDDPNPPDELDRERRRGEPDAFSLEPDKDPTRESTLDPDAEADDDEALRRRIEELRSRGLEDIDVLPGEVAPPMLY